MPWTCFFTWIYSKWGTGFNQTNLNTSSPQKATLFSCFFGCVLVVHVNNTSIRVASQAHPTHHRHIQPVIGWEDGWPGIVREVEGGGEVQPLEPLNEITHCTVVWELPYLSPCPHCGGKLATENFEGGIEGKRHWWEGGGRSKYPKTFPNGWILLFFFWLGEEPQLGEGEMHPCCLWCHHCPSVSSAAPFFQQIWLCHGYAIAKYMTMWVGDWM